MAGHRIDLFDRARYNVETIYAAMCRLFVALLSTIGMTVASSAHGQAPPVNSNTGNLIHATAVCDRRSLSQTRQVQMPTVGIDAADFASCRAMWCSTVVSPRKRSAAGSVPQTRKPARS